ncbi:MAG TPA: hypothetical protein VFD27_21850, partial [Chthoniobacteraceae bacterium]|nr:hypothetical protein [Chthoniobacteraceae bacterium]
FAARKPVAEMIQAFAMNPSVLRAFSGFADVYPVWHARTFSGRESDPPRVADARVPVLRQFARGDDDSTRYLD